MDIHSTEERKVGSGSIVELFHDTIMEMATCDERKTFSYTDSETQKDITFTSIFSGPEFTEITVTSSLITDNDLSAFDFVIDGLGDFAKQQYLTGSCLYFKHHIMVKQLTEFECEEIIADFMLDKQFTCRNKNKIIDIENPMCSIKNDYRRFISGQNFTKALVQAITENSNIDHLTSSSLFLSPSSN